MRALQAPRWLHPGIALAALAVAGAVATTTVSAGSAALTFERPHPWPTRIDRVLLGLSPGARAAPRTAIVAGFLVLTAVWVAAVALAHRHVLRTSMVVAVIAVWSLPLVLAAPLISRDVYAYIAQGALLHRGLDPYRQAPTALGGGSLLDGVDPIWRHATSPYGPLALLVFRAAATAARDRVVAGVLALRVVAVAATAATAWAVTRLVEPRRRAVAVLLVAGAPLVLTHFTSAAHVDAMVAAGVAGALLAQTRHHPRLALVLATCAAEVKVVAVLAVGALLLRHLLDAERAERLRTLRGDVVAVVVTATVLTLSVHDGVGWARGLGDASSGYLAVSLTTLARDGASMVASHLSLQSWRTAGLVAAVVVDSWLLLTVRRRPLAVTVGGSLAVLAVLAPAAWPWYLTWSLPALAVVPTRPARAWVVGVAGAGWAIALPFLPRTDAFDLGVVAEAAVGVLVVGARLAPALRLRGRSEAAG